MRTGTVGIDLREHAPTGGVSLDVRQISALMHSRAGLDLQPDLATPGTWKITASSMIGALAVEGLELRILPKIPIANLFRMLSISALSIQRGNGCARLGTNPGIDELVAHALLDSIEASLPSGVVRGYVAIEEESCVVRGRIDLTETVKRGPTLMLPLVQQVESHELDVPENQLIAGALKALASSVASDSTRARIRKAVRHFADATPTDVRRGVPTVWRNRLNARWWDAIELSRIVLHASGLELSRGKYGTREFLVDMNAVFERFVRVSLTRMLAACGIHLTTRSQPLWLDHGRQHELRPDLSAWTGTRCMFVGDCKYKTIDSADAHQSDLYQVLAYASSAGLRDAMLIYAASSDGRLARDVTIASRDRPVRVRVRTLRLGESQSIVDADLHAIALEIAAIAASRSHS